MINQLANKLGFHVLRKKSFDGLIKKADPNIFFRERLFYHLRQNGNLELLSQSIDNSHAQLLQDVFVLSQLGFKENGFFVEFGATDGKTLSNSFQLEKEFGWNGILAEPGISWEQALKQQRSASIDTRCVWKESGVELSFLEADYTEVSTISEFADADAHRDSRLNSKEYLVKTISLEDLLLEHSAPKTIDYLSIDTEGSEFEILQAFDFGKYKFRIITCEHNYGPNREVIYELLVSKGYKRVMEDFSQWDDWYTYEDKI